MIAIIASALLMVSCHNDEKMVSALNDYSHSLESNGYHFGDKLELPKEVTDNVENISISFGDKETSNLVVDPKFFILGDNDITFHIKTKSGKDLHQDATINVFTENQEKNIPYQIIAEYPHDPENFVQGFQMEGNIIYESDGQNGSSKIVKYTLGTTAPLASTPQPDEDFSEGCTIVGSKVYQLTWKSRKGYMYDKNSLKLLSEFAYPKGMAEGWGLTYDGKNLIASDGSKMLHFLDPNNPSRLIKSIAVAGSDQTYKKLNELEYHNGFIYANVWGKPFVLKINPDSGAVVGIFDFTYFAKKNTKEDNDVLNGIAFKGDNMVITGKNWKKIYEIAFK